MTLALVRHGRTDWNRDDLLQGSSDIPLDDTGRAQAHEAARALAGLGRWNAVVCSPLSRARETAEIIAAELRIEVGPDGALIDRFEPVERVPVCGIQCARVLVGSRAASVIPCAAAHRAPPPCDHAPVAAAPASLLPTPGQARTSLTVSESTRTAMR